MRVLAATLGLTVALLATSAAKAARSPTRAERAAITRAMRFPTMPAACLPLHIRVSTKNARYAEAFYRSTYKCSLVVGNGVSILKRVGYRRWQIVETGSSLGCDGDGKVAPAVMKDLQDGHCEP
jgi:hypothetical protein